MGLLDGSEGVVKRKIELVLVKEPQDLDRLTCSLAIIVTRL